LQVSINALISIIVRAESFASTSGSPAKPESVNPGESESGASWDSLQARHCR
jgi:hypothetical protein